MPHEPGQPLRRQAQLSRLVERAAAGEEIVIAKSGQPLARLVPLAQRTAPRELGFLAGRVHLGPDFDAPLPEDLTAGFGMPEPEDGSAQ